jgi:hypothetical protein
MTTFKNLIRQTLRVLKRLALPAAAAAIVALAPQSACAQQGNFVASRIAAFPTVGVQTNASVTLTNVYTNIWNTMTLTHGIPIETTCISTNAYATGTITNFFDLCLDNTMTNWTTTQPITTTATATGTTAMRSITVIDKSYFDGCYGIRLTRVGTGCTNWVPVTVRIGCCP